MRMNPRDLLRLIIVLTFANGAALNLCLRELADAIPHDLQAIIMMVLLMDVVILLLAFFIFKFPK